MRLRRRLHEKKESSYSHKSEPKEDETKGTTTTKKTAKSVQNQIFDDDSSMLFRMDSPVSKKPKAKRRISIDASSSDSNTIGGGNERGENLDSKHVGGRRIVRKEEEETKRTTKTKKTAKPVQKQIFGGDSPMLFRMDSPVSKKPKSKRRLTIGASSSDSNTIGGGNERDENLGSKPVVEGRKIVRKEVRPKRLKVPKPQLADEENIPDFDDIDKFELVVEKTDNKVPNNQLNTNYCKMYTSTPAKCGHPQRQLRIRQSSGLPSFINSTHSPT